MTSKVDTHADPNPSFIPVGKSCIFLLLVTTLPVHNVSHELQRCHNFQYLGQHIQIFWKKVGMVYNLLGIDTDPNRSDQDTHADPDPAK